MSMQPNDPEQRIAELEREIAALRTRQELLEGTNRRLLAALEIAHIGVWDFDPVSGEMYASPNWTSQLGLPQDGSLNPVEEFTQRLHPEDRKRIECEWGRHFSEGGGHTTEFRLRHEDGAYHWFLLRGRVYRDATNNAVRMLGCSVDISAHKRAEDALLKTNRALVVISQANQILIRATDEQSLLHAICEAVVQFGGFPCCWVAYPEGQDAVRLVAHAGQPCDLPEGAGATRGADGFGWGLACEAVRRGKTVACQDIAGDPACASWRDQARQTGLASCLSLPLTGKGETLGALTVFANEPGFFDDNEVRLLEEMAGDLAFGITILRDRAEREKAEAALIESENRYRIIFDGMSDALALNDENGNLVEVNPAYCRMHGYSRDELIGMNARQLMEPSRVGNVDKFLRGVRAGDDYRNEGVSLRKDGGLVPYEARGRIIQLHGKDHWLVILRDISARKRVEEALKDHLAFQSVLTGLHSAKPEEPEETLVQMFLSALINHYGFGIAWFGRLENGVIHPSISAARAHRHRHLDRLKPRTCDPASTDRLCAMAVAIRTREPFGYADLETAGELQTCHGCALEWGYRSNLALPVIVDGEVEGGILVYADAPAGFPDERVTRLRLLADELGRELAERRARGKTRKELQRLAIVVEQAAEEVFITDAEGIISYANPAFERITGYTREEVIGQNPRILKSGRHDTAFYRELWNILKRGKVWQGRIVNKRKDGRLIEEDATISPITDPHGSVVGYASVKRDVTEQVRLESQLRQAQKMEAIGTLAGGIAHDFNNILGAIIGYGEMALLFHSQQGSELHTYLTEMLKAAGRAKELVRQILTFSRQSEHEKRPVALTPIVKEVLRFMRASLPSTIVIEQEIETDRASVLADPVQMHQVLMNLSTNAAHAMRAKGGILTVGLRAIRLDEKWVERSLDLKPGAYVELSVSDTGEGIPAEFLDRIFEPYFTTKEHGEGTGLGLAVVHGIVRSHNGAIRVYSEPGAGTTIRILLPSLDVQVGETDDDHVEPLPCGSERILFVDDEESLVEIAQRTLESLGYQVTAATSSVEALALFREDPASYDLLITDLTMPQLTGIKLAEEIKRVRRDLPILLCTGFSKTQARAQAEACGIDDFLHKPLRLRELAQTVRDVLDRTAPAAPTNASP